MTQRNPWDAAIEEAKKSIRDLKFSIKEFEKRKARDDKWMGKGKLTTNGETRDHAI